jgi:hypothetical protein
MNGRSSIGELVIGPTPAGVWGATRLGRPACGSSATQETSGVDTGVGRLFPACATIAMVAADVAVVIGGEAALRLRC